MESNLLNYVEFMNELTFLSCLYICFLFTDITDNYDYRSAYGRGMIYLVLCNIILNAIFLIYCGIIGARDFIRSLIEKFKHKKEQKV